MFQCVLWLRCLSWSALTIVAGSLVRGQELNRPLISSGTGNQESTQSEYMDESVPGNGFKYGPISGHLDLVSSVIYNDNIYIQPTQKTSDVISTLSPGVTLEAGDYLQREESWATLIYSPSFLLFAENPRNDAIDQDGRLNLEYRPASWTFGLEQEYLKLSGPIVEAGNRINRSTYDTHLYVRYDFSPRTSFEIDGNQSINDYPEPLFSFNIWTASEWMDYWITPKIQIGVGATEGVLDVSRNPHQTYQQLLTRFQYDLDESLHLRGSIGAEVREFQDDQSNRENGIYSLGGTYTFAVNTQFLLDAYRRDESSLVAADQNYTLTGGSLGLRQTFADKYTLNLTAGFDHSEYYATREAINTNGQYNYFFVRPGFTYQITSELMAEIFYQYQQNRSSQFNAFTNNQTGVDVTYHF
jgi:hypothetical protein